MAMNIAGEIGEIRALLKEDLIRLDDCMAQKKLEINVSKTKFIVINSKFEGTLRVNQQVIERERNIKYLGFVTDEKLKFDEHIEYIYEKIAKKVGVFRRVRKRVSILCSIKI